jgi:hypothetical protein
LHHCDVISITGGGIYNSTNGVQANELQTLLVDSATVSTATYDSCTCVIVKPHAVKAKSFGKNAFFSLCLDASCAHTVLL